MINNRGLYRLRGYPLKLREYFHSANFKNTIGYYKAELTKSAY